MIVRGRGLRRSALPAGFREAPRAALVGSMTGRAAVFVSVPFRVGFLFDEKPPEIGQLWEMGN